MILGALLEELKGFEALNLLGSRAWRDALQFETRHFERCRERERHSFSWGIRRNSNPNATVHGPAIQAQALIWSLWISWECRSAFGSGRDELFGSTFRFPGRRH